MPVEHGPPNLMYIREMLNKEARAYGRPPPKKNPFSHSINAHFENEGGENLVVTAQKPSAQYLKMFGSSVEGGLFAALGEQDLPQARPRRSGADLFASNGKPPIAVPKNISAKGGFPFEAKSLNMKPARPASASAIMMKNRHRAVMDGSATEAMEAAEPPAAAPPPPPSAALSATAPRPPLPPPPRPSSAASVSSLASSVSSLRSQSSSVMRANERQLRRELERLKRVEKQTAYNLQWEQSRRRRHEEDARRFAELSGPALRGLRFDLGNTSQKHMRSSVDRIVFGHDIDGSEEFEAIDDNVDQGPRRYRDQRNMRSKTDEAIWGRDLDQSNVYKGGSNVFLGEGERNSEPELYRQSRGRNLRPSESADANSLRIFGTAWAS